MRIPALLFALLLSAGALAAQSRVVELQRSPDGSLIAGQADGSLRLWVRGFAPESGLRLQGFSQPAFVDDRTLLLTRTWDDGRNETARERWRIDLVTGIARRVDPVSAAKAGEKARARSVPEPDAGPRATAELATASPAVKLCIDAGHGGSDPGALGNGLRESDINLDVCLRLWRLLEQDTIDAQGGGSWDVLLTRTADDTVSLQARTDMANAFGAASFLSVHMNAFTSPAANGTETFCFPGLSLAPAGLLRNRVQAGALTAWDLTNRGVKEANFFVLRETAMPAALLEGGFITNPGDSETMARPGERQTLARELLFALQEHHGFPAYEPVLQAEAPPAVQHP